MCNFQAYLLFLLYILSVSQPQKLSLVEICTILLRYVLFIGLVKRLTSMILCLFVSSLLLPMNSLKLREMYQVNQGYNQKLNNEVLL